MYIFGMLEELRIGFREGMGEPALFCFYITFSPYFMIYNKDKETVK